MKRNSQAKIISFNKNNVEICASAARISTTKGDSVEIFEKAGNNTKNQELINKVLRSGHKSVIEHAVFTIAFCDVSAFVEQFFIECRLASFTVKSRRYVDFSKLGYYIPPELENEELADYCQYMDMLFQAYQTMLEGGIPKEDARFLLPYSFHSNFYCTLNARELVYWIYSIRHGRGQDIPELQNLADQVVEQLRTIFPCVLSELEKISGKGSIAEEASNVPQIENVPFFVGAKEAGSVSMINAPSSPYHILEMAYRTNHPKSAKSFQLDLLFESERLRELEQLSYSFFISDITLSGITHIVRHRMQSILIPSIQSINHSRYIVPDTVKNNPDLLEFYKQTLKSANDMARQMSQKQELKKYNYYYALSGNTMDVMTTINARELNHLIKLRACNRAQWEIRKITIDMLKLLRNSYPELFQYFGPSCYVNGVCPEGTFTCNKMNQVIERFENLK